MTQELAERNALVTLQTSSISHPILPPWLAEAILVLQRARDTQLLNGLQKLVRVPRGRAGLFEVCDFVLLLLVYAVSNIDTLKTFFDDLRPCKSLLPVVWARLRLPSRSALSRFLAVVPGAAVEALRPLLFEDLLTHGLTGPRVGGLVDRSAKRHVLFDVDGTHQVARQRQVVGGDERPPVRRRLAALCARGYRGRHRGDITRTRTTLQQAHTGEWLGTWGTAGNGDVYADLAKACVHIARYLVARGLATSVGVVRLDGLYGHVRTAVITAQHDLGYVMRAADYRLLALPPVVAALAEEAEATFLQPDTGTERQVWDIPGVTWTAGLPSTMQVITRVIVTSRLAGTEDPPKIGKRVKERIVEVFVTERSPEGWTACDVLSLYFARGGFEQTLAHEDREQEPDRWVSGHPEGQEMWQLLSQWLWNVRLQLGVAALDPDVRQTLWAPPLAPVALPELPVPVALPELPVPVALPELPVPAALPELPAPVTLPAAPKTQPLSFVPAHRGEVAPALGRGAGKYGGTDFVWTDNNQLRCPAGARLHPTRGRVEGLRVRVMFTAPAAVCGACEEAAACRGHAPTTQNGRRVSVWYPAPSPPVGVPVAPAVPAVGAPSPPRPPPVPSPVVAPVPAQPRLRSAPGPHGMLWEDVPATKLRRIARVGVHAHRIEVTAPFVERAPTPLTRAQRAHRRLTWEERLARNAHPPLASPWTVHLYGIPEGMAAYLAKLRDIPLAA